MTIDKIAQQYIERGLSVIPVPAGKKAAASSWSTERYGPDDFRDDDNIALRCGSESGHLVDVDCDAEEAVKAAALLLPQTGLIHGRTSKRSSHYWYRSEGCKSHTWHDVKGAAKGTLIEIRSDGGYTVIPPSRYGANEQLIWELERAPLALAPDDLVEAVRDTGIAAFLARHWPGPGQRHAVIGPLAGLLSQGGMSATKVIEVIKVAAQIAGDSDVTDRVNYATSTVAKFRRGERVTGGPTLGEYLDDAIVSRLRGFLRLADVDAIEEMNRRHFWVRLGKDDVIGREDTDDSIPVFQRVRALHSEYANRRIAIDTDKNGEPVLVPLFKAWLESPQRRTYRRVVFEPPPFTADPRDYNLWRGFGVSPAPGQFPLFDRHIRDVICSGNESHADYLYKLLALTAQQPGIPSEVAVVLRGEPGTGKGMFVRALMKLFEPHAVQLDNTKHLVGGFNAALSGKILVFADEAVWAGDKRGQGALKRLITEPTLNIERKGIDADKERNCIHLFVATNEDRSIHAMLKERRYFAVEVSSAHRLDREYFAALSHELDNGGLAAFLDHLLKFPVDHNDVRNVPITAELRNQQEETLAPEFAWLKETLETGDRWPKDNADRWVESRVLYDSYCQWARNVHPSRDVLTSDQLGRRLAAIFSAEKSGMHRFSGQLKRGWKTRTLADARRAFDERRGCQTAWGDLPDGCADLRQMGLTL